MLSEADRLFLPSRPPAAVAAASNFCESSMTSSQPTNDPADGDGSGSRAAELLAKADLFSGVDRVTLAKLAANLDAVSLAKDEAACRQGEMGDSLYLVSEGSFGVFVNGGDQRLVRVATLERGACFGEMALLTGERRSATVLPDGAGELLRLDHDRFQELVRKDPSIGLSLSASLSRRLRTASQTITETDAAIRHQIARRTQQTPVEIRTQMLQAGLLMQADAISLHALFADDGPAISERLTALGWVNGAPSVAVARALKDAYAEAAAADAARDFALQAIEPLVEAGSWRNALAFAETYGDGPALAALLGRALRVEDVAVHDQANPWLARLNDAHAEGDVVLAVARANAHAAKEAHGQGVVLLQRALVLAQGQGDASAVAQLEAEIARHSAFVSAAPVTPPQWMLWWASVRARPARFAAVTMSVLLILAAIIVSPHSKAGGFVLLLGAAIVMWVVAILPEFVVYVGLVIGWVFLGIAEPAQAVKGFGSTSWILILAILAISSTARTRLLLPTAVAAAQSQRFKDGSPESAFLGLAAFVGASPLLYIFLNGSSSNFLGLGLIPEASRARFDLAFWFIAAAPLALFCAIASLAVLWIILRPGKTEAMSHQRIDLQLSLLGPLAAKEIACRLDVQAVVDRAAKAESDCTVTIRPAPDTMTYVTALLPVAKGVGVYAASNKTVGVIHPGVSSTRRTTPSLCRESGRSSHTERVRSTECAEMLALDVFRRADGQLIDTSMVRTQQVWLTGCPRLCRWWQRTGEERFSSSALGREMPHGNRLTATAK